MGLSPVYITNAGVIGPTGSGVAAAFDALLAGCCGLHFDTDLGAPTGPLARDAAAQLETLSHEVDALRRLDRTALLAVAAAREATRSIDLAALSSAGVVIGSSRGAQQSMEIYYRQFLETGKSSPSMSPVTTPVTLPAAVAAERGCGGPVLSVSAACQTGATAIGTALSLIQTGQMPAALAGGAEACLTAFTIGSLLKLKLLSERRDDYPLRSGEPDRDGMVLSEGATVCLLAGAPWLDEQCIIPRAQVLGFTQAHERGTLTGISSDADALRRCLRTLLEAHGQPDLIIGHLPGTVQGDAAEAQAYAELLRGVPVTGFKWSVGHMLGASAAFAVAMALEIFRAGRAPGLPFATERNILGDIIRETKTMKARTILVTALGFGGNASAILLKNMM